ncbi:MAG: transcription elongation factor subunit Spt4 [Nanoarchaeota archaeon]
MTKEKVCRNCDLIYEGDKCPGCGSQEYSEEVKGRVVILDPEKSEIGKKIKITKKGSYAIKSK